MRDLKSIPDRAMGWCIGLGLIAIAMCGTAGAAPAQGLNRQNANAALSSALIRLNHNPRDAEALIAAGNAAMAMGDTDAAAGFFTRALRLTPDNPRIAAGLASAKVHGGDPITAIALFITAEKAGALSAEALGNRGLAYDLIGDNTNARQYYRQALAMGNAGGNAGGGAGSAGGPSGADGNLAAPGA